MIKITVQDITRQSHSATHDTLYAEGMSPAGTLVKWDFLKVPIGSEITEGHANFATRFLNKEASRKDERAMQGGGGGPVEPF